MNVLVLNAGSSTLKFELIRTSPELIAADQDERLCRGTIEGIGGEARASVEKSGQAKNSESVPLADVTAALEYIATWLSANGFAEVNAVGHRVVHGGELFSQSALIDDGVLDGIRACADLAPLHNPKNLEGIVASSKRYPGVPQAAVFDTAFHQTLPEHAFLYAVPYDWYSRHRVRRYGFHGTSHRYVAHRYRAVRKLAREQTNIITLHLGNGCSMAAIKAGRSIDTSMGMTPLEGLMMGTRSGDLDPGILSVVASRENMPLEQVENALNFKSGLLGISGLSNDMRELQKQAEHGNGGRAALAIEIFCYRARKYLGAYLAAMGGADAIVFTGGIGENSAPIRARICEGFGWAGVALDRAANAQVRATEARISTPESKLSAYVIPTDEELLIARDTVRLILGIQHPS